mgnify:CR=1 FL=1
MDAKERNGSEEKSFKAAVITVSDKGARGERVDESGPAAKEMLEEAGYEVVETLIIPDEPEELKTELIRLADEVRADLVVTSGGIFHAGSDSGGDSGSGRPVGSRNCRGHPVSVHGSDEPGHAQPWSISDPQTDRNRQPSGKSEGGKGESGLYFGFS